MNIWLILILMMISVSVGYFLCALLSVGSIGEKLNKAFSDGYETALERCKRNNGIDWSPTYKAHIPDDVG